MLMFVLSLDLSGRMRGKGQDWSSSSSLPPHGSSLQTFLSAKEGDEGRGMWQRGGKGKSRECARYFHFRGRADRIPAQKAASVGPQGACGKLSQGLFSQSWRAAPCLKVLERDGS